MKQLNQALLLSLAFLLAGSAHTLAQGQAAKVIVDVAEKREVRDTQPVIGQLVATRRADIATRTAGVINEVTFEVGDRIARGQSLVQLDSSRIEIEKEAAKASLEVAKAGLDVADAKVKLAEIAFKRQDGLKSSTAFSRSRYDDLKQAAVQARSERAQAEAQMHSARSNLNRAEYDLKHSKIKAPFDGVVIARQAQPGQYMSPGGTVATLLDVTNLEIEADVPSNMARGLKVGDALTAVLEGGARQTVTVRSTIPVQNVSTRTRPIRFTAKLDKLKAGHIAIGSSVTLQIPVSAPRTVVSVPKDALLQGGGGWIVYVVKDNKAMPRPVKIGQAVQDRIEVKSGVAAGDKVVIRGNERLRPGQSVRPQQVNAEPANAATAAKRG
ncbi:MAG: efflux RND transporter periplasmic adaptor subunit [Pseudomonadota bacterium]